MAKKLWTIGHSTRSLEEFVELLKENGIELLVDIRSLPGSNKFPHFNQENLEKELPKSGIDYTYMKILGGLRKKHKDSHNTVWRNQSFRNYADYMETEDFKKGIAELKKMASKKKTCICCAEAVWWRCHRSMVSDYMKSDGWKVFHILSLKKVEEHPYTQPAKIVDGKLVYGEKTS